MCHHVITVPLGVRFQHATMENQLIVHMMLLWDLGRFAFAVLHAGAKAWPFLEFETQTGVGHRVGGGRRTKQSGVDVVEEPLLQIVKARYGSAFSDDVITLALGHVVELYLMDARPWRRMWGDFRPLYRPQSEARPVAQMIVYRMWIVGLTKNWMDASSDWMRPPRGPASRQAAGPRIGNISPFAPKPFPANDAMVESKSAVVRAMMPLGIAVTNLGGGAGQRHGGDGVDLAVEAGVTAAADARETITQDDDDDASEEESKREEGNGAETSATIHVEDGEEQEGACPKRAQEIEETNARMKRRVDRVGDEHRRREEERGQAGSSSNSSNLELAPNLQERIDAKNERLTLPENQLVNATFEAASEVVVTRVPTDADGMYTYTLLTAENTKCLVRTHNKTHIPH